MKYGLCEDIILKTDADKVMAISVDGEDNLYQFTKITGALVLKLQEGSQSLNDLKKFTNENYPDAKIDDLDATLNKFIKELVKLKIIAKTN